MHSEVKKEKLIKKVCYEIWMFRQVYKHLCDPKESQSKYNAYLESFVIHAYNLYRFFYQGEREKSKNKVINRKPSDIIAEDFNISRKSFRKNRTSKKLLKGISRRRDKELAHLTVNRIYKNSRNKSWNIEQIYRWIEKTINAFLDSLPQEERNIFLSNI